MAKCLYSVATKQLAFQAYAGGRRLQDIANELQVPLKTIHSWHTREGWCSKTKEIRAKCMSTWEEWHDFRAFNPMTPLELLRLAATECGNQLRQVIEDIQGGRASVRRLQALTAAMNASSRLTGKVERLLARVCPSVPQAPEPPVTEQVQEVQPFIVGIGALPPARVEAK